MEDKETNDEELIVNDPSPSQGQSKNDSPSKAISILIICLFIASIVFVIIAIVLYFAKNTKKSKIYEKYEFLNIIGEGSSGIIYKGKNKENNEIVAIKKIPLNDERNNKKEDIENEMKFMEIFSKFPNSVKLFDKYNDIDDEYYIVMELCEGAITQYLPDSKEGFTIYEIKVVMKQLNTILHELRSREIIHDDMKLENILIKFKNNSKEFDVKLADYGKSKLLSTKKENEWGIKPITNETLIKELEKNDLYVIGVDLYRMYFNEKNVNIPLDDMQKKLNDISDKELKNLVEQLLVKDYNIRIDWSGYFNHSFFDLDVIDYENVTHIVK